MGRMLSDSLLRCEMIGCYPRAARCVYEASNEGPTKTMGAKINCLMTLIRYSQKKWATVLSGSGGGKEAFSESTIPPQKQPLAQSALSRCSCVNVITPTFHVRSLPIPIHSSDSLTMRLLPTLRPPSSQRAPQSLFIINHGTPPQCPEATAFGAHLRSYRRRPRQ